MDVETGSGIREQIGVVDSIQQDVLESERPSREGTMAHARRIGRLPALALTAFVFAASMPIRGESSPVTGTAEAALVADPSPTATPTETATSTPTPTPEPTTTPTPVPAVSALPEAAPVATTVAPVAEATPASGSKAAKAFDRSCADTVARPKAISSIHMQITNEKGTSNSHGKYVKYWFKLLPKPEECKSINRRLQPSITGVLTVHGYTGPLGLNNSKKEDCNMDIKYKACSKIFKIVTTAKGSTLTTKKPDRINPNFPQLCAGDSKIRRPKGQVLMNVYGNVSSPDTYKPKDIDSIESGKGLGGLTAVKLPSPCKT